MIKLLATLALLALAPAAYAADTLPPDLAAVSDAFDKAQIDGDGAALGRILADDYRLIGGGANVEDKAQFIADFTAPGFKLDPFTVREKIDKVWADGAITGGLVDFCGTDGGKHFCQTFRFSDVWARRDGTWKLVYSQVTRVPPPAPTPATP
ncbi:hypothetical protein QO010_004210 [Caulobacter ginsengisoli]|uniref:DUF4440 domain-containing protein n=1 Tax=Caulobacter ginsengisoli TaxID=400775 RepID=A0ABU0IWL5_9CAUL|nr:nuclear transport factor 2 family protein [Caulobacter ginsengisoli]MDQ0466417.1 hypothetical protein [Caulobacter ginsengisoli]